MENTKREIDILSLIKVLWSVKRKIAIWSAIGFAVGVVIALSIPRIYSSTILVYPESNTKEKYNSSQLGTLAGLAGVNLASNGMNDAISTQLYPVILKTTPFLMSISQVKVPYEGGEITLIDYLLKEQRKAWWSHIIGLPQYIFSSSLDDKTIYTSPKLKKRYIEALSGSLKIEEAKKNKTITITANLQSPEISCLVVDTIFVRLQEYVQDYQTKKLRENLSNAIDMLEKAKINYYDAEEKYAQATDRNQNLISKSASIKIDRLRNECDLAFAVYQQLAAQVENNRIKLYENTPIATILEPASVPIIPYAPNRKLIVVMMTFLGFAAACAVVVIRKYFLLH